MKRKEGKGMINAIKKRLAKQSVRSVLEYSVDW